MNRSLKFQRGIITLKLYVELRHFLCAHKAVGRVMVLVFCALPDDA